MTVLMLRLNAILAQEHCYIVMKVIQSLKAGPESLDEHVLDMTALLRSSGNIPLRCERDPFGASFEQSWRLERWSFEKGKVDNIICEDLGIESRVKMTEQTIN